MAFNSLAFLIFFTLFFFIYWRLNKKVKLQNLFLLTGSYLFYAWADWRFLSLLAASSLLNYFLGISIEKAPTISRKKVILIIGLCCSLGILFFFKYYNFFIESFATFFELFNIKISHTALNIIAPLGISFYTFRIISYLLDIYFNKIKASREWLVFFNYVSFFPAVISGPIDKSKTFIPQLKESRKFDFVQAADGSRQILWGLFKKAVIADNCAVITNDIFSTYHLMPASTLWIGIFLYTIQIYADFSGYSDMAIGISQLMGFNITRNFDYPLFSQNIAEFWRKWHISLTSWLTEYVFTPLNIAFRDYNKLGLILAVLINFTIIGMWHGPNWTYVLFGFLHGCYFIPLILNDTMNKKKKIAKDRLLPSFREFVNVTGTFFLVMLTFILFRSESVSQASNYFKNLFSTSILTFPILATGKLNLLITLFFITVMMVTEWLQRTKEYGLQIDAINNKAYRLLIYYTLIFLIILCGATEENQFIYFKF